MGLTLTNSQHILQRAAFMIALSSLLPVAVQVFVAEHALAASQSVSFEISDPAIGFTAAFVTNADWTGEQSVKTGNVATIAYTLTPESGSVTVVVPLSLLGVGLEDQAVTVPLSEAPLGSSSISLSQSLVGIPQSVASINLVVQASIRMVQVTSTSSSIDMLTDINGLVWTSWGSKSIQLLTSEKGDAMVRATLEYTISVGVQATTLLTGSQVLIPTTPISGVSGTPELATSLSVSNDSSFLLVAGIGAAAGCAAIVAAIVILKRKSKKDKTEKTGGSQNA